MTPEQVNVRKPYAFHQDKHLHKGYGIVIYALNLKQARKWLKAGRHKDMFYIGQTDQLESTWIGSICPLDFQQKETEMDFEKSKNLSDKCAVVLEATYRGKMIRVWEFFIPKIFNFTIIQNNTRLGYWDAHTVGEAIEKAMKLIDDDISGTKIL